MNPEIPEEDHGRTDPGDMNDFSDLRGSETVDMGNPGISGHASAPREAEAEAMDPALQQQVDENLQLLYRSRLEASLPDSLQALVQKLLDEGKTQ